MRSMRQARSYKCLNHCQAVTNFVIPNYKSTIFQEKMTNEQREVIENVQADLFAIQDLAYRDFQEN